MDKQTEKWTLNYWFIRELTDENCNKSPDHQLALCLPQFGPLLTCQFLDDETPISVSQTHPIHPAYPNRQPNSEHADVPLMYTIKSALPIFCFVMPRTLLESNSCVPKLSLICMIFPILSTFSFAPKEGWQ